MYPNIWQLAISQSGNFKTTALNKGTKIAIENDKAINNEIALLKNQLDALGKESLKSGSNSTHLKEQIRTLSVKKVLLPDKTTPEALLEHLSEGHAGMIKISEFGAWLANMDKKHNNDLKGIFTDFYDVPSSYSYKTKTQGHLVINEPYITITAVSTMPWVLDTFETSIGCCFKTVKEVMLLEHHG